jgi:hypothetical protein
MLDGHRGSLLEVNPTKSWWADDGNPPGRLEQTVQAWREYSIGHKWGGRLVLYG